MEGKLRLLRPEEEQRLLDRLRIGLAIEPWPEAEIPYGERRSWKIYLEKETRERPKEATPPGFKTRFAVKFWRNRMGVAALNAKVIGPFFSPGVIREYTYFHLSATDFDQYLGIFVEPGDDPDSIVQHDDTSVFYPDTEIPLPTTSRPITASLNYPCENPPYCVVLTWRNTAAGDVEAIVSFVLELMR